MKADKWILMATIALVAPFLGKAFHVDDPLFVWAGRWIADHPFDFYGFPVNWYGVDAPMSEVMKNPPLTAYYLAMVGKILGFSEWAMHLGLLLPAGLVAHGTYRLAERYCEKPWLAALMTITAPVFLVSATTAMSDVMMLAFWIGAIRYWLRGIDDDQIKYGLLAGLLASLAVITKYSAVSLFPLFALYAFLRRASPKKMVLAAVVPLVLLGGYQWATYLRYGEGLLLAGAQYAVNHSGSDYLSNCLTGLSFVGGCLLPICLFVPLSWTSRGWLLAGLAYCALLVVGSQCSPLHPFLYTEAGVVRWAVAGELAFFALMGAAGLGLIVSEIRRRPVDWIFFAAWVAGVFVFTCFVNWAINGRSLLPMVPALAIVAARSLETREPFPVRWVAAILSVSGIVALAIAGADFAQAGSARRAARQLTEKYHSAPATYFEGHWGFQYYMQEEGAKPLDFRFADSIPAGSIIIVPLRNTNVRALPAEYESIENLNLDSSRGITTLDFDTAAGFYADLFGPLPFYFGSAKTDDYVVFRKRTP